MRWVEVDDIIDPTAHFEALPSLEGELPPGAWAFASDPDHYDFYGPRCVKDLTIGELMFTDAAGRSSLIVRFERNTWKHPSDLTVRYRDLTTVSITVDDEAPLGTHRLGSVILDELRPDERGCTHEVAFTGGTLSVVCSDLTATWEPSAPH